MGKGWVGVGYRCGWDGGGGGGGEHGWRVGVVMRGAEVVLGCVGCWVVVVVVVVAIVGVSAVGVSISDPFYDRGPVLR